MGGLLWAALGGITPVSATDAFDLSVGLKTLPLLSQRIVGPVNMAIVFDPGSPESRADADAIKAAADGGAEVPGGERLVPMLVAADDLSRLKGARLLFLTQGARAGAFDAVALVAAANGILSMSADLACVRANKCVLGIVSRPTVEIYFSRPAAVASHIGFTPAFTMLAKPN
ncbi:hypothetical protein [Telmatospirillum sp.]|uniref:hypothetical protein n=1 Tax=Telmatospirillum sp. TaxID=2079197 RepID=UPI00284AC1A4|nr:hypothetical protein [Telmatospirillum sp.]MDR3436161.1 hypothetical protein [Telmatospirillum sp.]